MPGSRQKGQQSHDHDCCSSNKKGLLRWKSKRIVYIKQFPIISIPPNLFWLGGIVYTLHFHKFRLGYLAGSILLYNRIRYKSSHSCANYCDCSLLYDHRPISAGCLFLHILQIPPYSFQESYCASSVFVIQSQFSLVGEAPQPPWTSPAEMAARSSVTLKNTHR